MQKPSQAWHDGPGPAFNSRPTARPGKGRKASPPPPPQQEQQQSRDGSGSFRDFFRDARADSRRGPFGEEKRDTSGPYAGASTWEKFKERFKPPPRSQDSAPPPRQGRSTGSAGPTGPTGPGAGARGTGESAGAGANAGRRFTDPPGRFPRGGFAPSAFNKKPTATDQVRVEIMRTSKPELRTVLRKLQLAWHPDKNPGKEDEAR